MNLASNIKPDIYFRRNGQIDISARVARMLSLSAGDAINVWHVGGEYYLYVSGRGARGKLRGVVYPTVKHRSTFRTSFKELTRAIIDACGAEEAHLRIGEAVDIRPIGLAVPLITRNNLYHDAT